MLGILDSGIGGLSVVYAIQQQYPKTDFVYLGDSKHTPYGNRPKDEILELTTRMVQILQRYGTTTIVIACHTISTTILPDLQQSFPHIAFTGMVNATKRCIQQAPHQRIAIVATNATINSEMYQHVGRTDQDIIGIPSTTLASAIETNNNNAIRNEIRNIIQQARENNIDALVLGCTHYPLALKFFQKECQHNGKNIALFDPASHVHLSQPENQRNGQQTFLTSKETPLLRTILEKRYNTQPVLVKS